MKSFKSNQPNKMQESTSDENEDYWKSCGENSSTINILNDDCMLRIFAYLPVPDKIRSERVCKRWNRLCRDSWKSYQTLTYKSELIKFLDSYEEDRSKLSDRSKLLKIFDKIMSRCGKYLKVLEIVKGYYSWQDYYMSECLKIYTAHTENLEEIFIIEEGRHNCEWIEDYELIPLFKKNKNLLKLKLSELKIDGECFTGLTDALECINLQGCKNIDSGNLFHLLVSRKNLLVFKLLYCPSDNLVKPAIQALTLSDSKIQALSLDLSESRSYNDELSNLFSMQINLQRLSLTIREENKNCLLKLKTDKITKICLNLNGKISSNTFLHFLEKCSNLNELTLWGCAIDSICAKVIGSCKVLKNLNLFLVFNLSLKPEDYKYFGQLSMLETFHLYASKVFNDNCLAYLSQCKQLNEINLMECSNITDTGLMHLTSLPKLTYLNVHNVQKITDYPFQFLKNIEELDCSCCPNVKNDGLCKMIMNAPNLKSLIIYSCGAISNLVIKAAVEAKKKFSNKNVLKINAFNNKIKPADIKDLPACIKVYL